MAFTAQKFYSFPIAEITKSVDGDFEIVGVATDGSIDADQQIVDPGWAGPPGNAIQRWLSSGANVRVMHNPQRDPAGIGVKAWTDGNGATWVRSRIVEPVAQKLIRARALSAYSIGVSNPRIVRDSRAAGGRIVGGEVTELTVCDRPSNSSCGITICKSVGSRAAYVGKAYVKGDEHWSVLDNCTCKTCMGNRKRCGCPECSGVVKSLKKAAKTDPGRVLEKTLRSQILSAAQASSDPWMREMARDLKARRG